MMYHKSHQGGGDQEMNAKSRTFFFWRSQPTRIGLTICLLWGNCCHRTFLCHAPSLGVNPSWGDQYHSLQRTRPARSHSSAWRTAKAFHASSFLCVPNMKARRASQAPSLPFPPFREWNLKREKPRSLVCDGSIGRLPAVRDPD